MAPLAAQASSYENFRYRHRSNIHAIAYAPDCPSAAERGAASADLSEEDVVIFQYDELKVRAELETVLYEAHARR